MSQTHDLQVFLLFVLAESPSIVYISASNTRSNTVRLGYSTALYCSVSRGTSPLQYKWYHNGIIISGATYYRYRIYNTQFRNAGWYACEVSNWVGRSSESYLLRVQGKYFNVKFNSPSNSCMSMATF